MKPKANKNLALYEARLGYEEAWCKYWARFVVESAVKKKASEKA